MSSSDSGSILLLLLIILFLIYFNGRYNNIIVKNFENFIFYLREFFYQFTVNKPCNLPLTSIPVYTYPPKCKSPCKEETIDTSHSGHTNNNIVNIGCTKDIPIDNHYHKNKCSNPCEPENKLKYGCYIYVLSYLPNVIHKYTLNGICQDYEQSKFDIIHNLGILKRIFINNNIIYVEDCNSNIHQATINPSDGNLTF